MLAIAPLTAAPDIINSVVVSTPDLHVAAIIGLLVGVVIVVVQRRRFVASAPAEGAPPPPSPTARVARATLWTVLVAWALMLVAHPAINAVRHAFNGAAQTPENIAIATALWPVPAQLAVAMSVGPLIITALGLTVILALAWRSPTSAAATPRAAIPTVRRTWRSFLEPGALSSFAATLSIAVAATIVTNWVAVTETASAARRTDTVMVSSDDHLQGVTWAWDGAVASEADALVPALVLAVVCAALTVVALQRIAAAPLNSAQPLDERHARTVTSRATIHLTATATLIAFGTALYFFGSIQDGAGDPTVIMLPQSALLMFAPIVRWAGLVVTAWGIARALVAVTPRRRATTTTTTTTTMTAIATEQQVVQGQA